MPHICSLPGKFNRHYLPPLPSNASFLRRLIRTLRKSTLVHPLHPRCKLYFRSTGAIAMERKRHVKTRYLYIIHPFSFFRICWETWMLIVFILSLLFLPLDLVVNLDEYPFSGFSPLCCALDVACCIDIMVTFLTGYGDEEKKEVVLEPKKIANNYIYSPYFALDVLSSIPSELVSYLVFQLMNHTDSLASKFFKILALTKLVRLRTTIIYLTRLGDVMEISQFSIRVMRYCILTYFTVHWLGCIHFILPVIFAIQKTHKTYNEWIYKDNTFEDNFSLYVNCIFRAACCLLGIERDATMITTVDSLLGIFSFVMGFVLQSIFYVLVLQMFLSLNTPETKYHQIINEIMEYMRHKKLPIPLQKRLVLYYDYRFQKTYFKESAILNTLSHIIVTEINLHMYRKLIQNVFILVNLPHNLVGEILSHLVLEVFLPNDIIIKAGTTGDCMYFLSTGTVCVLTSSGKEVCHLEEGSYFGEIALVSKDNKRTADVIAIEICQIYRLDRKSFITCIATHTDIFDKLEQLAFIRKEQTLLIEELHKKYILEKLTALREQP